MTKAPRPPKPPTSAQLLIYKVVMSMRKSKPSDDDGTRYKSLKWDKEPMRLTEIEIDQIINP